MAAWTPKVRQQLLWSLSGELLLYSASNCTADVTLCVADIGDCSHGFAIGGARTHVQARVAYEQVSSEAAEPAQHSVHTTTDRPSSTDVDDFIHLSPLPLY